MGSFVGNITKSLRLMYSAIRESTLFTDSLSKAGSQGQSERTLEPCKAAA
jgi:hypothetical protein